MTEEFMSEPVESIKKGSGAMPGMEPPAGLEAPPISPAPDIPSVSVPPAPLSPSDMDVSSVMGAPGVSPVKDVIAGGMPVSDILAPTAPLEPNPATPEGQAFQEQLAAMQAQQIVPEELSSQNTLMASQILANQESSIDETMAAISALHQPADEIVRSMLASGDRRAAEVAQKLGVDVNKVQGDLTDEPDPASPEGQAQQRLREEIRPQLERVEEFDENTLVDEEERRQIRILKTHTRPIKDMMNKLMESKGFRIGRNILFAFLILVALAIIADFKAQTGGAGGKAPGR